VSRECLKALYVFVSQLMVDENDAKVA